EGRVGKGYEKIGYYDLDLASYAGCGKELKACLLYAYESQKNNPANAYLEIKISCTMKANETITDPLFKRPYADHPYTERVQIKNDTNVSNSQINNPQIDSSDSTDTSTTQLQQSQIQKHPPGHSRQASKSSMKSLLSNHSTSTNPPSAAISPTGSTSEKCHQRQASDDSTQSTDSVRKAVKCRRAPYFDEFGDIQRRLHATRVDANEIVNNVMLKNAKTIQDTKGFLCLIYNEDGSTRVGTSSKLQSSTNSLFVS
ncbi:unnamed protein product, partial [Didymodactylos carnosus]